MIGNIAQDGYILNTDEPGGAIILPDYISIIFPAIFKHRVAGVARMNRVAIADIPLCMAEDKNC